MDAVERRDVATLVIAHKDRLTRFGYVWFARLCANHGCTLLVLNNEQLSPEREMVEDLMTIVHCFSARLYVWKATLDDVLADIKANRTAGNAAVIHNLYRRGLNDADREAKLDLLRHDVWFGQPLLRRLMRRHWQRGKTAVDTHVVLDA